MSTSIEERATQAYQGAALEEVRTEHKQYFDALEQHPRLLAGTEVPRIDGQDGMERLRDAADAREWQEAVKSLLAQEVRDRASKAMDENAEFLTTVHSSLDLFKNNRDLIPGTKDFDRELADKFVEMAEPYEVRVEDKLQGYTIPVQPIIDQLRRQLTTGRAAGVPVPAAAAGASGPPAKAPAATPEPPQAGITSKAGSGDTREDFSTLFGTLGLHDFQI
jgi:hypothetical protein